MTDSAVDVDVYLDCGVFFELCWRPVLSLTWTADNRSPEPQLSTRILPHWSARASCSSTSP